jgi:hypothetical protein
MHKVAKLWSGWLLLAQGEHRISVLRFSFFNLGMNYLHVANLQYSPQVLLREKYTQKIISKFECNKMHTLHKFIESFVNLWMSEHQADKAANGSHLHVVHRFNIGVLYFKMSYSSIVHGLLWFYLRLWLNYGLSCAEFHQTMASPAPSFTKLWPLLSRVSPNYGLSWAEFHQTMASPAPSFTKLWPLLSRVSPNYGLSCAEFHQTMTSPAPSFTKLWPLLRRVSPNPQMFVPSTVILPQLDSRCNKNG